MSLEKGAYTIEAIDEITGPGILAEGAAFRTLNLAGLTSSPT